MLTTILQTCGFKQDIIEFPQKINNFNVIFVQTENINNGEFEQ